MKVQPNFWENEEKPAGIPVDNDKGVTIDPDGKIKVDNVKDPINEEDRKERFNLAMQQKRQNGGR
ncbi:MAG: hypothetical protein J6U64_03075 [Alphaproteobacteria bacterium]|nr:hypothetical protein [Alphaproteobacteria bacterium]